MRIETKYIRDILKKEFPEVRFRLMYREPHSYRYTSDKLIVRALDKVDLDDVEMALRRNTKDIAIYIKGERIAYLSGKRTPQIKMPSGEWHDADILEFIEIRRKK